MLQDRIHSERARRVLWLVLVVGILSLVSACCFPGKPAGKKQLSKDWPYAIKVRDFQSAAHADQLRIRLHRMGIESYLVTTYDSSTGPRTLVLTGTSDELTAARTERRRLSDEHDLKGTEIVLYKNMQKDMDLSPVIKAPPDRSFTPADPPASDALWSSLDELPKHNDFVMLKLTSFLTPEAPPADGKMVTKKHKYSNWKPGLNLPRGLDDSYLREISDGFTEVLYRDTLDETDLVTLLIVKLRLNHGAGGNPAETFANKILDTGDYSTEKKDPWSSAENADLSGYEVMIEPKAGNFKRYLVLADQGKGFAYVFQPSKRKLSQLEALAKTLGEGGETMSEGYFHGLIRTLPSKVLSDDVFVGLQLAIANPKEVTKARGYNKQAPERLRGYWLGRGFYYHDTKAAWSVEAIDLKTQAKVAEVERNHAGKKTGKAAFIHGTAGVERRVQKYSNRTWKYYYVTTRIQWARGRYLATVKNNAGWLDGTDLKARGNLMQLTSAGGWNGGSSSDPAAP